MLLFFNWTEVFLLITMPHMPTYRELEAIVDKLARATEEITESYRELVKLKLANTSDSFAYVTPMNCAQDNISAAMCLVKNIGEN